MLGALCREPRSHEALLRVAPRSLRFLSDEHQDGWGIASFTDGDWSISKGIERAADSPQFASTAETGRAEVLVAHVRKKTVGPTALRNTHPFRAGRYVFAHNGTVRDLGLLARGTSPFRAAAIRGDTDSERYFAYLMSHIDEEQDIRGALVRGLGRLLGSRDAGSLNFLLSDGESLYAFRFGRTLFTLVRHGADEQRRAPAILVASEPLTDEPWRELPQGQLIVARSRLVLPTIDFAWTATVRAA